MPSPTLSSAASKEQCKEARSFFGTALTVVVYVASGTAGLLSLALAGVQSHALNVPILNPVNIVRNTAWGPAAKTSMGEIVFGVIFVLLGILGVVFVVLLVYAGFLWLTAGGEEDKTKKSLNLITNAIIGMLVVVSAYAISYFVLSKFGRIF